MFLGWLPFPALNTMPFEFIFGDIYFLDAAAVYCFRGTNLSHASLRAPLEHPLYLRPFLTVDS